MTKKITPKPICVFCKKPATKDDICYGCGTYIHASCLRPFRGK